MLFVALYQNIKISLSSLKVDTVLLLLILSVLIYNILFFYYCYLSPSLTYEFLNQDRTACIWWGAQSLNSWDTREVPVALSWLHRKALDVSWTIITWLRLSNRIFKLAYSLPFTWVSWRYEESEAHTNKNSLKNQSTCQVLNSNLYKLFPFNLYYGLLVQNGGKYMVCLCTKCLPQRKERILKNLEIVHNYLLWLIKLRLIKLTHVIFHNYIRLILFLLHFMVLSSYISIVFDARFEV